MLLSFSRPAVPTQSRDNMKLSTQREQMSSVVSDHRVPWPGPWRADTGPFQLSPVPAVCVLLNSQPL